MRAAWLPLMLLLAGCSDASDPNDGAGEGMPPDVAIEERGASDVPAGWQEYSGSFDLLINPDTEVFVLGGTSTNCVLFWEDAPDYHIGNGTAILTWTPGTPAASQLRIRAIGAAFDAMTAPATSPATLEFEQLPLGQGLGIGFWADYTLQVPVMQEATIEFRFLHLGDLPEPAIGTCGGGGP